MQVKLLDYGVPSEMQPMGLYCVRGMRIYTAYIMPVAGRSVALWAVCLASCTPEGERAPPPCREGVRRVAENFKKNKKDYKLSFSY